MLYLQQKQSHLNIWVSRRLKPTMLCPGRGLGQAATQGQIWLNCENNGAVDSRGHSHDNLVLWQSSLVFWLSFIKLSDGSGRWRCLYREASLATIAVSSGGGSMDDYYWEPGEKETGSPVRVGNIDRALFTSLQTTCSPTINTTTTTATRIITNISFYI